MSHLTFPPNSVAVVTDGASGIGLAAAVRFARVVLKVRVAGLGEDRTARAADVLAAAAPPASWPWSVNRAARPRHRLEHLVPLAGGKLSAMGAEPSRPEAAGSGHLPPRGVATSVLPAGLSNTSGP